MVKDRFGLLVRCNPKMWKWHEQIPSDGREVEIDWTGDIDETNEVNNVWSGTIVVNPTQSDAGETANKDGTLSAYSSYLWVGVVILGLLGILVFMYGPNQIQKIE